MIAALYIDETDTAYDFKMPDGTVGTNHPDGARWKDYEEMRVKAAIIPDKYIDKEKKP